MMCVCSVFSLGINGLQRLLDICGDYVAEHKITFNCDKAIGVLFYLKSMTTCSIKMFF